MRTPLVEAIINNHIEVARYLVQNSACVYHVVSVCFVHGIKQHECELAETFQSFVYVINSSGGGWIHGTPPRSQTGQPRDGQHAAGDGTGRCECTGKEKKMIIGGRSHRLMRGKRLLI